MEIKSIAMLICVGIKRFVAILSPRNEGIHNLASYVPEMCQIGKPLSSYGKTLTVHYRI